MSDNSGSAFPVGDKGTPGAAPYYPGTPGLTKRELFAAMAMAECIKVSHDKHSHDENPVLLSVMIHEAAQFAVRAADALLAELAK